MRRAASRHVSDLLMNPSNPILPNLKTLNPTTPPPMPELHIHLTGDFGAGKTVLARNLAHHLLDLHCEVEINDCGRFLVGKAIYDDPWTAFYGENGLLFESRKVTIQISNPSHAPEPNDPSPAADAAPTCTTATEANLFGRVAVPESLAFWETVAAALEADEFGDNGASLRWYFAFADPYHARDSMICMAPTRVANVIATRWQARGGRLSVLAPDALRLRLWKVNAQVANEFATHFGGTLDGPVFIMDWRPCQALQQIRHWLLD